MWTEGPPNPCPTSNRHRHRPALLSRRVPEPYPYSPGVYRNLTLNLQAPTQTVRAVTRRPVPAPRRLDWAAGRTASAVITAMLGHHARTHTPKVAASVGAAFSMRP